MSIFDLLDSYMHICGIIWYKDPLLHPYEGWLARLVSPVYTYQTGLNQSGLSVRL